MPQPQWGLCSLHWTLWGPQRQRSVAFTVRRGPVSLAVLTVPRWRHTLPGSRATPEVFRDTRS